jgi:hypothetical protein
LAGKAVILAVRRALAALAMPAIAAAPVPVWAIAAQVPAIEQAAATWAAVLIA